MLRITSLPPGPRLGGHVRRIAAWTERAAPATRTEAPLAGTVVVLSLGPPFAARALLGIPVDELRNRTVPLADVPPGACELTERVADAPDPLARLAILDDVLGARIDAAPPPSAEVLRAYARLAATHGAAQIERLADEVGWSRRHLATRFRREVGASPKTVARILRFERAVELLRSGSSLADAAFSTGYADQPHFKREFRALMGMSPTEFRFVQDTPAAA